MYGESEQLFGCPVEEETRAFHSTRRPSEKDAAQSDISWFGLLAGDNDNGVSLLLARLYQSRQMISHPGQSRVHPAKHLRVTVRRGRYSSAAALPGIAVPAQILPDHVQSGHPEPSFTSAPGPPYPGPCTFKHMSYFLIDGKRKGSRCLNTRPTRARQHVLLHGLISCPSNIIFPDMDAPFSVSNPFIHRSSVVFPHPDDR